MNTLYYGDNLKILREHIKDESVDLIYLDPPFNSNRNYNVLFRNESGTEAEAQITAFEDTWHWNIGAEETYNELINEPGQVGRMIESFRSFIGQNQMMAYLVMMAVRLKELHRVLKPTGSLYLHCDPTASHYLKILLDAIFGPENFSNEIIWKRTTTKNDYKQGAVNWPRVHDVILMLYKDYDLAREEGRFEQQFEPYSEDYTGSFYKFTDESGRKYGSFDLTAPGQGSRGHPKYEFLGHSRYWRYNQEKMEQLLKEGRIIQSKPGSVPRYKRYLDEMPGVAMGDTWTDLRPVQGLGSEYLGYPTQKPVALLERILQTSTVEGDIVLDPFCGCGTTIAAAQKLNREWIGIDVTHLAVGLIKLRLKEQFGMVPGRSGDTPVAMRAKPEQDLSNAEGVRGDKSVAAPSYRVIGQPEDLDGAKELASKDRYGFQWWILPLIGAKAYGSETGKKEGKKGADSGVDGSMVFIDDNSGKAKRVIVSVKSGGVSVSQIRDLAHVVEREKAAIGVFLTLEPPTKPMLQEAIGEGFYHSDGWNKDYPKIQIITVEEILSGKTVNLPPNIQTFKKAERIANKTTEQQGLEFGQS